MNKTFTPYSHEKKQGFYISTEQKVIGGGVIITIAILVVAIFFLTKDTTSSIPKKDIITQNGLHWHPKLSIYIKGKKQELTDGIGLGAAHLPLHTHTEDFKEGVVHMEMSGVVKKDDTKLGNFFKIWGKKFSSTQIFDKENGNEGNVKMIVNGKENTDFENYLMRDNDMIEIRYE